MTVCFFKAGGGYISSFGTNWLKLTWTSKSHFVWHGVFTSLLISVERRWSQSCFRNSTFPLTCGLTGTIEHLQKLETNKVHPNYGPYIEDQLIFIYIYIFLKGVTRFWMDIWGGHIFLVATSIVFLYGFFHLDCLITRNPWILMKPIYWWEGGWTKLHHKLIISLDEIILNLDKSMSKIHVFIYIYNLQLRSMKLIKLMIQNSFSQVSERLVSFWHFLKDGFRSSEIVINSLHQRQRWNLNHLERSGESVLHKGTFFKTHIHHWLSGRQALFP